jgi:NADH-quinone oxidoreductase subunit J
MGLIEIVFYVFALLIVSSAVVVAVSRNIMYAAFGLMFTFFGVAGLYVLLNADFIAITQVMVYIGGILILIIFGVILTTNIAGVEIQEGPTGKFRMLAATLITLMLFVVLLIMYLNAEFIVGSANFGESTLEVLGTSLMTKYLLPFEVAAVLLLIALVGAALIARRK